MAKLLPMLGLKAVVTPAAPVTPVDGAPATAPNAPPAKPGMSNTAAKPQPAMVASGDRKR